MNMVHLGLAFVGGGAGAVLRLMASNVALRWFGAGFPIGTLSVNVLGSFAMGLLVAFLAARGTIFGLESASARVLLATGFLGGFTTFSAFSLDVISLYERGQLVLAGGYVALSVGLAIAGLCLGLFLGRSIF
jgi:CrcB protein